eukprot:GHVL01027070.1.p1 GENE.GHVL01027070.1~~GHVL01027070.1.p1  ORF type:complete len:113 (-),score=1.42 GHVL01027070.1:569-907(-)
MFNQLYIEQFILKNGAYAGIKLLFLKLKHLWILFSQRHSKMRSKSHNSITLKSNSFGKFFYNGNITTRNTLLIPSQTAQSTDSNFKKQSSSIHNKRSKINKGVSQRGHRALT